MPRPTAAGRRILGLLREELPALSAGTVLLVLGAGLSLLYPQGIRAIVDGAVSGRDPARVSRIALLLAGLAILQGAAIAGRHLLFSLAGERGVRRVRERLYASLVSQEIGFFDGARTGELVSRLGTDCATLQNLVSAQVSMTFRHAITALGGVVLLFFTSPRLTVVMLLVVPPVALGAVWYGRKVRALARRYQDALADASHVAEESLSAIRTVRSFVAEEAEQARYGRAVDDAYDAARRRAVAGSAFMGSAAAGGYAAMAAVLGYGGALVARGSLTPGALTAFLVYTLLIAMSLGALAEIWAEAMRGLGAADRVFALMDRVPLMPLRGGGAGRRAPSPWPLSPGGGEGRRGAASPSSRSASPTRRRPDLEVLSGLDLVVAARRGRRARRRLGRREVHGRRAGRPALRPDPPAGSSSTAATCATSTRPGSARRSGSSRRSRSSSRPPSRRTCGTAGPARRARRSSPPAAPPTPTPSSAAFPDGYATKVGERGQQLSGRAAPADRHRPGGAQGSRASCSSTRRRARSTPSRRRSCRTRSRGSWWAGPRS